MRSVLRKLRGEIADNVDEALWHIWHPLCRYDVRTSCLHVDIGPTMKDAEQSRNPYPNVHDRVLYERLQRIDERVRKHLRLLHLR